VKLSTKTIGAIIERWHEEGIVTDYASEYGEPGYGDDDTTCVVLGDYWCSKNKGCDFFPQGGTPDNNLHGIEVHHPLLWAQLEAQGVEFEWYDEWTIDHEADKAYRTSADSYSWTPSFVWTESGDMLTVDTDLDTWIEWAIEDPTKRPLLPRLHTEEVILNAGFTKHNGRFESGWYEGQNDNPAKVLEELREQHGEDIEALFRLDSTGQFDVGWSAYWRVPKGEEEEE